MRKKGSIILLSLHIFMIILSAVLLVSSIGFKRDSPTIKEIVYFDTMEMSIGDGEFKTVNLPCEVKGLEPGTIVTLRTKFNPKLYDGVYVKSNYAKANVYFDNKLVFKFGKDINYPRYMTNPATEIHVIETYGNGQEKELKIKYFYPNGNTSLFIEPPMLGTSKELILERSMHYGFSWMFALVQMVCGVALVLISLFVMFIDRKSVLFFWLGVFSFITGLCFFGSNDFSITVFPDSTFLYLSAFIGVVVLLPPLIRFIRIAVDFKNPKPLIIMEVFFVITGFIALYLQLFGIYPLHKSKIFFSVILIFAFAILSIFVICEYARYRNEIAKRMILPLVILTVSDLCNFALKFFPNIDVLFPPIQIGILAFMLIMGTIAGMAVNDSLKLKRLEKEIEYEKKMLDIQKAEQRESRLLLVENERLLSNQRHDLRHHLAAIKELINDNKNSDDLNDYLNEVMDKIPKAKVRFCENSVVNAIVSHFVSICEQQGIKFSANIVVPETKNHKLDSDLCVIFANLLENATEACIRMDANEEMFIKINSVLKHSLLAITMDNSFNGEIKYYGNSYKSSKRDEVGIGLTSIKSIANEHHGNAEFKSDKKVFLSSVYLNLE